MLLGIFVRVKARFGPCLPEILSLKGELPLNRACKKQSQLGLLGGFFLLLFNKLVGRLCGAVS